MQGILGFVHGGSPVYSIGGRSLSVTLAASTPTLFALPTLDHNGQSAPFIVFGGANADVYFSLGDATVDASGAGSILVSDISSGDFPIHTRGQSHLSLWRATPLTVPMSVTPLAQGGQRHRHRGIASIPVGGMASDTRSVTVGATTEFPLPVDSAGRRARFVYVWGVAGATVRPGFTGGNVHSPQDGMSLKSSYPRIIDCQGYTHLLGSAVGPGGEVTVSPLEDF